MAPYLDDALYRGAHHMAARSTSPERDDPARCGCGILGDLEAEGPPHRIGRRYRQPEGLPLQAGFASKRGESGFAPWTT